MNSPTPPTRLLIVRCQTCGKLLHQAPATLPETTLTDVDPLVAYSELTDYLAAVALARQHAVATRHPRQEVFACVRVALDVLPVMTLPPTSGSASSADDDDLTISAVHPQIVRLFGRNIAPLPQHHPRHSTPNEGDTVS